MSRRDDAEAVAPVAAERHAVGSCGKIAAHADRKRTWPFSRPIPNTGARVLALTLAIFLLAAAAPSLAVEDARPDSWKFDLDVHAWLPQHNVTTTAGDDLTIGIGDVLSALDFTLQLGLKARKRRWRLFGEVLYVKLSSDDVATVTRTVGPSSIPVQISADYTQKAGVAMGGVGYNLVDKDRWTLDMFGGVRYLDLDLTLTLDSNTRVLPAPTKLSDTRGNVDGIVAASGIVQLSDRWYARYYADVGTGDSDLTWVGQGVVAYRFKSVDAYAGWRYMAWNGVGNNVIKDLSLNGPILGARFRF